MPGGKKEIRDKRVFHRGEGGVSAKISENFDQDMPKAVTWKVTSPGGEGLKGQKNFHSGHPAERGETVADPVKETSLQESKKRRVFFEV